MNRLASSRFLAGALLLLAAGCRTAAPPALPDVDLVDGEATRETKALFYNLRQTAGQGILYGHQDDLAYGVGWAREPGRSDTKEVTGAYPAVYGWEVGHLEKGADENLDGVRFSDMRRWIREGYDRGGAITVSWHMDNPVSGGSTWDTTRAVHTILPGGLHHETFKAWLDRFAAFAGSLTGPQGEAIPLLFRPYHEHTGSWFWWGRRHATPDEYKRLWRFTVEYLRDEKGVHNLLYAYSPNSLSDYPFEQYFEYYPGDEWVDVLGVDDYGTLRGGYGHSDPVATFAGQLRWLVEQAEARGKIPALTETGYEGVPDPTWLTSKVLAGFKADSVAQRIAYVLLWRNAQASERSGHFFAPPPGHPSAASLVQFRADPLIRFGDELPRDLYRFPGAR